MKDDLLESKVELLRGDVKLTETVNFCETIEESEGEELKDSPRNSSPEDLSIKSNKVVGQLKGRHVLGLKNRFNSSGRNSIDLKRCYTIH